MLDTRDKLILCQMLNYIDEVEGCIEKFGKNFNAFNSNFIFKNSVSMSILQIGELENKLSEEFLSLYDSYYNWDDLRKMRNRYAHTYLELEESTIWGMAIRRVPALKEAIGKILSEGNKK